MSGWKSANPPSLSRRLKAAFERRSVSKFSLDIAYSSGPTRYGDAHIA